MAYLPKPPKVNKKPPILIPTSEGKRNATPMSQNKKYSTGVNQWGIATAGGKQIRMGPTTQLTPLRQAPVNATIGEQLRNLLKGNYEDTQKPSGVAGVRG